MKKLNSNSRILEDPAASAATGVIASNFILQQHAGSFTQREINGGGISSSVSPRGHQVHGSANQIQLASG
jgi:hypothetical protein